MHSVQKSRSGTRGRPEESRASILQAAVREFAREGVAGARTDAIVRSAGVNKALLYYYFKDKEALYDAVLDEVFSGVSHAIRGALSQPLPPRERLKAYVRAHFDYIAAHPPAASFASTIYWGVHAFPATNSKGETRFIKFKITPVDPTPTFWVRAAATDVVSIVKLGDDGLNVKDDVATTYVTPVDTV